MSDRSLDRITAQLTDQVQRLKQSFLDHDDDTGDDLFAADEERDRDFQDDAAIVSTAIIEQFSPETVFEIGCGIGMHLKPFLNQNIRARGIDESPVAHENAVIPKKHIRIVSMQEPYSPDTFFDMVLCIDVLEYTSRRQEDTVIETIANAGRTAVVSVPLPRFSKLHYDHEEPEQYWVQKFQDHGMNHDKNATDQLQDRIDAEDEAWVPEQLMVFTKNGQQ